MERSDYHHPPHHFGDVIAFDVGGRIFRVRRSLIDSFPSTMLARAAAQVWYHNNNNSNNNNYQNNDATGNNDRIIHHRGLDDDRSQQNPKRQKYDSDTSTGMPASIPVDGNDSKDTRIDRNSDGNSTKPIFIDRDGHRFSYVLDYMRDGGIIELPVTISKDSFIKDLIYYGFDNISTDHITVCVPTYEAVLHIESLHTKYQERIFSIELEKDYVELSYAIFKQFVEKRSATIIFRTNTDSQNICKIAQSLAREYSTMVHSTATATSSNSNSSSQQKQQHQIRTNRFHHSIDDKRSIQYYQNNDTVGDMYRTHYHHDRDDNNNNNVNPSDNDNNNGDKIISSYSPTSKFLLFNKCLQEYGLQCKVIDYESGCSVTMKIAPYDKS